MWEAKKGVLGWHVTYKGWPKLHNNTLRNVTRTVYSNWSDLTENEAVAIARVLNQPTPYDPK